MRQAFPLSQREREIIDLAAEGCTDAQIAERLGIRRPTVGTYWNRIRIKIGGGGRTELVAHVLQAQSQAAIEKVTAEFESRLMALAHEHDLCHELMENAPDAILVIQEDGRIYAANHEACRLFGYETNELNTRLLTDLIPVETRGQHSVSFDVYVHNPGERPLCFERPVSATRKDGSTVLIRPDVSVFRSDQGTYLACVIRPNDERCN